MSSLLTVVALASAPL